MAAPATSPQILLFARGTLALLDLWPALTIAVAEEWGGPESAEKKTWIASTIIDEFESCASYLPAAPGAPATEGLVVDPASAGDSPIDVDQLGDLLQQIMEDEFEARLEDGSIDSVSADVIRLWRDVVGDAEKGPEVVRALEGKAAEVKKSGVKASKQANADGDDSSDESGDEDEDMEVDGEEAPQLEPREREHQEPVVDDDGFTLVQKPRRR